jgi:diaminopimelate epimerase
LASQIRVIINIQFQRRCHAVGAREKVAIQTGAGVKLCTLASVCGNEYEFELAMGQPNVESEFHIRSQSEEVCGIPVSMGNPHFVIFVQEFPREWQKLAADIQNAGYFKQGINVEFVSIVDKHNIEVRFYERGVGETQSSGPDRALRQWPR